METETRRNSTHDTQSMLLFSKIGRKQQQTKPNFWMKLSTVDHTSKLRSDERKLKKNIFQDQFGLVGSVPDEHKVSYWLRRRKRENASEKTFFLPQRPLRFRTIPPLLFPALFALPAIIGGINKRQMCVLSASKLK